ncbi:hypothetical protein N7509_014004 [Penicillium cosmopolitanum]|uniref:Sulfite efflux pump SSU1 n=1 Tax=Penicillium cosmopolitanum TaxID=1131564 RepID=A0A9W9S0D6_9EURO|nr:uncharacterized protein N7509_014004 [Penicillium cosmopolitanum]KAJ5369392.1 hypothetical protein N7509_014004 [Penicillium cosmopolitanum]
MSELCATGDIDQSVPESQRRAISEHEKGWRRIVRNFTPAWFSVNMGTGIVSILLFNMPYNGAWLYWLSVIVFAWNVFLFCLFLFISILRYSLYPDIWLAMIRHPAASMFLGTFPMGLATIVEMVALVCVPAWGPRAATLAWALWWIDSAISVVICYCLPFIMLQTLNKLILIPLRSMYVHDTKLSTVTAVWLLPIAASIVASATGGVVAEVLPDPRHALWTVIVSYILWGTAIPLSMSCLVIYLQRLMLHNLPPREAIMSVFLPIAPLGQGAFAIMQLGKVALDIFPKTDTLDSQSTNSGAVLYVMGWLVGIIMWSFGVAWIFFALASISRSRFPFNMSWWGFTFPLGVFTGATTALGKEIPSRFFSVLSTILSVIVILLWLMVSIQTTRKAISREIFVAPYVKAVLPHKSSAETKNGSDAA